MVITPDVPKVAAIASLRINSSGANVLLLQQALIRVDFSLKVDGHFGKATETAVKACQSRFGLVADGVVGSATKQALGLA